MYSSKEFYKERVQELTEEMNTSIELKEIILNFIEKTVDIPTVVLDILKPEVKKLKVTVKDCELRLTNYK